MMDEPRFWSIIDSSRRQALAQKRKPGQDLIDLHEMTLAEALRRLSPAEIIAFAQRFDACRDAAYRWDLWGVAYWMHGGCGDDSFLDFRSCLISLGKDLFTEALKDADSLADIVGRTDVPFMQSEGFQYVAGKVYKEKTKNDMPFDDWPKSPKEPLGEQFDFDDEELMAEHFPRLLKKMPEMGD